MSFLPVTATKSPTAFGHFNHSVMSESLHLRDCCTPGFPVQHQLPELLKLMSIESVMPSNHLILCHTLLFLLSIFPRFGVHSNESILCIRWPKYWSFSISASNEYSGLISFRVDRFDLLAVQWDSQGGHADYASIKKLVETVNPTEIIPIHTEAPEKMVFSKT